MILDAQNYFTDLANGDAPGPVGDTAGAYVLDQSVKEGPFKEGGGAVKNQWIKAVVQTAFTSAGAATIQAVLQDSPDNITYTDRLLGPIVPVASAVVGSDLFTAPVRFPSKLKRYSRMVWRIAGAAMTGGKIVCFLVESQDIHDLSQRKETGIVVEPVGAMNESVPNGILAS